jgi:hypothetical protein
MVEKAGAVHRRSQKPLEEHLELQRRDLVLRGRKSLLARFWGYVQSSLLASFLLVSLVAYAIYAVAVYLAR